MSRILPNLLALLVGFDLFTRMLFGVVFQATDPGHWFATPGPARFALQLGLVIVLALAGRRGAGPPAPARGRSRVGRRQGRGALAALLLGHAALATGYSWTLPLFEGADETSHFDYARSIAVEGRLPSLALDDADTIDLAIDQKIQPPGYYLLLAPLLAWSGATHWSTFAVSATHDRERWNAANWVHGVDELEPYGGDVLTFHRLRLSGLLFSCLALLGLFRAVRQARVRRGDALAVTAFAAFLPQFVHLAGILSNDLPTLALGPWIVALGLRFVRRGTLRPRSALALGALLGAALVSKLSAFVFLPWLALTGLQVWAARRAPPLRTAALVLVGAALLSGWYWVYQHATWGNALQNWVFQNAYQKTAADQTAGALGDPWTQWAGVFVSTFALSFFCDLGWMKAWPANPVLIALAAGLFLWWVPLVTRTGRAVVRERARPARRAAFVLFVLAWVAQVRFNLSIFQPMGRHHFPFLAVYLIGFALALEAGARLLGARRPGLVRAPAVALAALALLFGLHGYDGVLRAQFHPPNAAHDPRFRITDHDWRTTPATIRLLSPAAGEEVRGAPTFRWEAETGRAYGLELHHDPRFVASADYRLGQRILRTFEMLLRHRPRPEPLETVVLEGGTYTVPAALWAGLESRLPSGGTVYWRIRSLPRRAEEPIEVSAPRAFVRR